MTVIPSDYSPEWLLDFRIRCAKKKLIVAYHSGSSHITVCEIQPGGYKPEQTGCGGGVRDEEGES